IYNSRSSSQFTPAAKERFVFSMGRIWDEAKNVRLLVDAATGIKYPIRIAGENQFQNNRVDAAHSNVTYLGKLASTEVAEQLSKASLYVLPAKYEPFGLSVLEAALSGCTLVLGKIDSLQELWEGCAVFVDTHDTDNLAATVNYLMRNDAVRSRYAEKAHVRARYFSPDRMAANYFETYQQLLQEHAPVIEQQNI
ncbi:MAG TPA: glycosyltransferase, partial [Chitinophagaceae bacterium]|nr:glycosyltransferase [Chitinophagaceae bacterium]